MEGVGQERLGWSGWWSGRKSEQLSGMQGGVEWNGKWIGKSREVEWKVDMTL